MKNDKQPLFSLGQTIATDRVLVALTEARQTVDEFLQRHQMGDWGIVSEEEREDNDLSVQEGARILSAYTLKTDAEIWVMTEGDRSRTKIGLPFEF